MQVQIDTSYEGEMKIEVVKGFWILVLYPNTMHEEKFVYSTLTDLIEKLKSLEKGI